jgi:uncharacterized membrane protein
MSAPLSDLGRPGDLGPLEQAVGWASLALGVPQTLAPGAFNRAIGAPDGPRAKLVTVLACGTRELAAAGGVLAAERPWPVRTLVARLAGDALDMGLLVASWRSRPGDRNRVRLALAAATATAIGTADVLALARAKEQADGDTELPAVKEHPKRERTAVTVRAPLEEVKQRWEAWDGVAPKESADFVIAPGGRGTEVRVNVKEGAGQPAVELAKRVAGRSFDQQVADDLRHFKQTVETGEVLRSDGSPEGPSAPRLMTQRPAQPVADPTPQS